jgi:hypothetical protein
MPLPTPVPGLVICYSYLWYREHQAGHEEGVKDRPCAIIAAIRDEGHGTTRVLVLPVTHAPPSNPNHAVEIPALIKRQLKLDDVPSWVVLTEWNEFVWPGPDLRRLTGVDNASFAYGILPRKFFNTIRDRFLAIVSDRAARHVRRT